MLLHLGKAICKRFLGADIWRYGGNDIKQKRTYTFGSNFKYLTFSLTNEKFSIHPKTVKVKCPRKFTTYGYRHQTSGGGRDYTSSGRVSWMVQTHLKDGMSCKIIYRLIMPSEKVNLFTNVVPAQVDGGAA